MSKTWIRILAIICMLAMVLPFLLTAKAAPTDRYGYKQLANDNQRIAYNAIADGIASLTKDIKFNISGITQENVQGVIADIQLAEQMVVKDFPEYFWFYGGGDINIYGAEVTFTPSSYSVGGQQVTAEAAFLKNAKAQMDQKIKAVLAKISKNASDYEIAHTIHDHLVDNVSYEQVGDHQTAYGALVSGKAVCAGYARAYQLLMLKAGLDCWYVSGQSYDPSGNLVAHAWNLAWLDGKCYYSDATWDDQNGELFHEYLNMSLEEISKTHFTSDPLPASCGHDTYTFFRMSDGDGVCDIRDHKDAEDVADCFEMRSKTGDEAVFYCTIHYHGENFSFWLNQNVETIAIELGFVGSYTCDLIELGHEHHVTLKGQVREDVVPPAPPATVKPTVPPTTAKPTVPPTTAKPTVPPTTAKPTVPPTTAKPTEAPTTVPPTTVKPTEAPTTVPPTVKPTEAPTTVAPTVKPTEAPTTVAPTVKPTEAPTTVAPTVKPTEAPTTVAPTVKPTEAPTTVPPTTGKPTEETSTVPPTTAEPTVPPTTSDEPDQKDNTSTITTVLFVIGAGVIVVGGGAGLLWLLPRMGKKKF